MTSRMLWPVVTMKNSGLCPLISVFDLPNAHLCSTIIWGTPKYHIMLFSHTGIIPPSPTPKPPTPCFMGFSHMWLTDLPHPQPPRPLIFNTHNPHPSRPSLIDFSQWWLSNTPLFGALYDIWNLRCWVDLFDYESHTLIDIHKYKNRVVTITAISKNMFDIITMP